jgi:hypothetical protein
MYLHDSQCVDTVPFVFVIFGQYQEHFFFFAYSVIFLEISILWITIFPNVVLCIVVKLHVVIMDPPPPQTCFRASHYLQRMVWIHLISCRSLFMRFLCWGGRWVCTQLLCSLSLCFYREVVVEWISSTAQHCTPCLTYCAHCIIAQAANRSTFHERYHINICWLWNKFRTKLKWRT